MGRMRTAAWSATLAVLALACNFSAKATASYLPSTPGGTVSTQPVSPSPSRWISTDTPTVMPSYEKNLCGDKAAAVALLADPSLADAVRADLDRYESDLCAAGYGVIERSLDFGAPPELRAYLADLYARTGRTLEGAIFIGNPPLAYQSVAPPSNPNAGQEVISFQYYSDLDGTFSASNGYRSRGGHEYSFDQHTGDVDWEIWTAVLPRYDGDRDRTVDALDRYFDKNHRYRMAGFSIPEGFLLISEHFTAQTDAEQSDFLSQMRNGQYAWTPFSNSPQARIYFNGPTISVEDGYADLSAGKADIAVTETHGDYTRSGRIDIDWVESWPVRAVLFWTDGCSVGNLDYPRNFLTSIVYSPTSEVLAAKGSTNDSGGLGTNTEGFYGHNVAVRLAAGKNLGQAILGHVNVPLIAPWSESREFHVSMLILVGDPTLRLRNGSR
jgi:hypothetical protein